MHPFGSRGEDREKGRPAKTRHVIRMGPEYLGGGVTILDAVPLADL